MVLLLLTSARDCVDADARQRLFVTTSWGSAAAAGGEGARLSVGGRGTTGKAFSVWHSVAQQRLCCTDFFTGPRGDAATAASDERRGQYELAEVRPREVQADAQRQ